MKLEQALNVARGILNDHPGYKFYGPDTFIYRAKNGEFLTDSVIKRPCVQGRPTWTPSEFLHAFAPEKVDSMKTKSEAYIRRSPHGPATKFTLVFNWSGMTEEQMRQLAQQALYVNALARMRRGYHQVSDGETVEVLATEFVPLNKEIKV